MVADVWKKTNLEDGRCYERRSFLFVIPAKVESVDRHSHAVQGSGTVDKTEERLSNSKLGVDDRSE